MKLAKLFICLFHCSLFAQSVQMDVNGELSISTKPEKKQKVFIGERGLNRTFIDSPIAFSWSQIVENGKRLDFRSYAALAEFRLGNNFYLGKGRSPMILRCTYFRNGFFVQDGIGLYFSPPSLGLGKHIPLGLGTKRSFHPMIHTGYVVPLYLFEMKDIFNSDYYWWFVTAETKFNFSYFSLGVETTFRKLNFSKFTPDKNFERYFYLNLTLGVRIGKKLTFN